MADEARSGTVSGGTLSGTVAGVDVDGNVPVPAAAHPATAHHHGRPVSWVAVSIIMAGFLAGGLGLVFGPLWWLFWAGGGLSVLGALLALATDIFEDWY